MELQKILEGSFPRIEKLLSDAALGELAATSADELAGLNFGIGTIIRLKLLRPKSPLYRAFCENGFSDKERMSYEIMRAFQEYLLAKARIFDKSDCKNAFMCYNNDDYSQLCSASDVKREENNALHTGDRSRGILGRRQRPEVSPF